LLQAGPNSGTTPSPSLLQWGSKAGENDGDSTNPGFITDVFARVGGSNDETTAEVSAQVMVVVLDGNVVIDNAWYYRADHGVNGDIDAGKNPSWSGLHVYGKNCIVYGLNVDNTQKNQVEWYGEGGGVWGFNSMMPVDAAASWGGRKYATYMVDSAVKAHTANGVGATSKFRDAVVEAASAFTVPDTAGVSLTNAYTLFLGGIGEQDISIGNVVNSSGGSVGPNGLKGGKSAEYVCHYSNSQSSGPSVTPVEEFFLQ
jgi:hypothetical protein